MIPLHYSFSHQARTNPLFHYSLKLSFDAALAMIPPEPDRVFAQLIAIGGGTPRGHPMRYIGHQPRVAHAC